MQTYENPESLTLFDVETLLYVQEAKLDKFMNKLNVSKKVAHTNQQTCGAHDNFARN